MARGRFQLRPESCASAAMWWVNVYPCLFATSSWRRTSASDEEDFSPSGAWLSAELPRVHQGPSAETLARATTSRSRCLEYHLKSCCNDNRMDCCTDHDACDRDSEV